tara:strand:+ start:488 stop:658 length:171 start_codon:yes stop_codon:yes gene_type:complete
MKNIFFLLFLLSCSTVETNDKLSSDLFKNIDNLNYQEFKSLLKRYNDESRYPEIDQ